MLYWQFEVCEVFMLDMIVFMMCIKHPRFLGPTQSSPSVVNTAGPDLKVINLVKVLEGNWHDKQSLLSLWHKALSDLILAFRVPKSRFYLVCWFLLRSRLHLEISELEFVMSAMIQWVNYFCVLVIGFFPHF